MKLKFRRKDQIITDGEIAAMALLLFIVCGSTVFLPLWHFVFPIKPADSNDPDWTQFWDNYFWEMSEKAREEESMTGDDYFFFIVIGSMAIGLLIIFGWSMFRFIKSYWKK